jgi:serine/threonine protein kinase
MRWELHRLIRATPDRLSSVSRWCVRKTLQSESVVIGSIRRAHHALPPTWAGSLRCAGAIAELTITMSQIELDKVGRFELISLLGEGGMAQVYLALLRGPGGFNKLGVIKRIRPEFAYNPELITMFLSEARLAARLSHPNVVQTYQVVEEKDGYGLAMEYLEGQPLSEVFRRLGRRGFTLEEHLWILSQVLAGLQYAHTLCDYDGRSLGIVHRDINPANVLLTYEGDVKVLDFGIAKVRDGTIVTRKGTLKGKLGYCAPEQVRSLPVDARADVFAVGVMLWEALAGKRMARGATAAEICDARVSGAEPRIREVRPNLLPSLAAICDRAIALNPEDRYATAAELAADIDAYLEKTASRVGRVQIGARLQRHFDHERQLLRQIVEAKLSMPFEAASKSIPTTSWPREPTTRVEGVLVPSDPVRWNRRRVWLAAAAVALTAVAGIMLWRHARTLPPAVIAQPAVNSDATRNAPPRSPRSATALAEAAETTASRSELGDHALAPNPGLATWRPYFVHLKGWWERGEGESLNATPTRRIGNRALGGGPSGRDRRLLVHARAAAKRGSPTVLSALAASSPFETHPRGRIESPAVEEAAEPGSVLRHVDKRYRQHIDEEDPYSR